MKVPEIGQFVRVRKRPAIVRNKVEFSEATTSKRLHMLDIEYFDGYDHPPEDRVVWEKEIGATPYSVLDFPNIDNPSNPPDKPERYHAFMNALTWTSHGKISLHDTHDVQLPRFSLMSPWFSAIQVEDYQLYPVLQALSLPRVNLLLADDVGLGKTIEAGLILQELIRQRRIRRILIVCPSSLQIQWQDEMKEKFNLDFSIINSDEVYAIQRELGLDANPWTVYPKIITSMDYLKQTDILNQFRTGSDHLLPQDSVMLPWDLLIVDEAHNFSPARLADDSNRCTMLGDIVPYFEHRLFLTATPHNGYTTSFSGLLELLDPVRFQQKTELTEDDIKQLGIVMIRRMKEELNKGHDPPRFPLRDVVALPLHLSEKEVQLYHAMEEYRLEARKKLGRIGNKERALGEFIFSLLTKRLLSSSYAFARTWWNHVAGFGLTDFGYDQAKESRERAETPVDDDDEKDRRESDAVRHGAGWLTQYHDLLRPYLKKVTQALEALGWSKDIVLHDKASNLQLPPDMKWEHLLRWIRETLQASGTFRNDERVIIFTEYKDTLDYLLHRFKDERITDPQIQILFGGAPAKHRRLIKEQFNEPLSPLRILLATDAASEGLNLQTSCRYVIHQEIPWNPMRMEQRNGRVDRHGQTRDVTAFHFVSDQIQDLKFLSFIARKVNTVRGDLGSTGKVLDEAVMEYFATGKISGKPIDERVQFTLDNAQDRKDLAARNQGSNSDYERALGEYHETRTNLGITEQNMARLLDEATKLENGTLGREGDGVYRFEKIPPKWKRLVDRTLALSDTSAKGAYPKLVFSPERVIVTEHGRSLFRPAKDTRLLMLGHPLMERALSTFRKRLWTSADESLLNRWTIEQHSLPDEFRTLFILTFQVSLRNQLGERFQVGIHDLAIGVRESEDLEVVPDETLERLSQVGSSPYAFDRSGDTDLIDIRSQWLDVKRFAETYRNDLLTEITSHTAQMLELKYQEQKNTQEVMFQERMKALEFEKNSRTIERLRLELIKAEEKAVQLTFSEEQNRIHYEQLQELRSRISDAEWERRHGHVELLKRRLENERKRIIEKVLPRRYKLDPDGIDVLAAGVRIIVHEGGNCA